MKKQSQPPESAATIQSKSPSQFSSECWFDDACILDIDFFVKTLSGIKSKGVSADLIGSIITHYASKWLPDLSSNDVADRSLTQLQESSESVTVSWMKKRFFVETLIGVLPPEKNAVPCNFLLRILRTGNMVGIEPAFRSELEKRISRQLDEASLKELMIPSFSYTCGTLLDVELVIRLVKRFVSLDGEGAKSGAALVKVSKLVDYYLAEAAMDANLSLSEFVALASALPAHARATDDGLYRAIDTYLKAHPGLSKQEKKGLCRLIDSQKLTLEASLHAAQNDRLPVRAVIQVLFSEHTKLNRHVDWNASFSGPRSPNAGGGGCDRQPGRCLSKREIIMNAQQMEIKKLKEDVRRLQGQCSALQAQMEKMVEKKKGIFRWKKLEIIPGLSKSVTAMEKNEDDTVVEDEVGFGIIQTPMNMNMKTRLVKGRPRPKWRRSMS